MKSTPDGSCANVQKFRCRVLRHSANWPKVSPLPLPHIGNFARHHCLLQKHRDDVDNMEQAAGHCPKGCSNLYETFQNCLIQCDRSH